MRVPSDLPHNSMIPVTDPVQELRLRAWARSHYVPSEERKTSWHPIVLDEMLRRDAEPRSDSARRSGEESAESVQPRPILPMGSVFVPLAPESVLMVNPGPIVHPPHMQPLHPHLVRHQEYVVQSHLQEARAANSE